MRTAQRQRHRRARSDHTPWRDDGWALVVVLLATSLLSAIGSGLILSSATARLTVANLDEAVALSNASEAALELAARELAMIVQWDAVLSGAQASTLVDGSPGTRTVAAGDTIDLVTLTNRLACGRSTPCTDAQVQTVSAERPWGVNNPKWQLFLHRPLGSVGLPRPLQPLYIVVWIGDDGRETDGDAGRDGAGAGQEGRYMVRARAEAFGARGARHAIEAELARVCADGAGGEVCAPGIRVQSWRVATAALP